MPQLRRKDRKLNEQKSKRQRLIKRMVAFILLLIAGAGGLFFWRIYSDIATTTDKIYTEVEKVEKRPEPIVVDKDQKPFSLLILGVDTGDAGRVDQGRSDTMMLMTVNPAKEQSTIVSIPRDTYTEIVGHGTTDKINHAYAFGGPSMAINSVQNLLDVPIDYYVSVDMKGMKDLIDAVGGVSVRPGLSFKQDQYSFTKGVTVTLNGDEALAYSRMRKEDPAGDYGRQARQREIIEASIKKVASFSSIVNYRKVLSSLENNLKTNLAFDDMVDVFQHYRAAASTVEQEQLTGEGTMINGVYYDIIGDEELMRVSTLLRESLKKDSLAKTDVEEE